MKITFLLALPIVLLTSWVNSFADEERPPDFILIFGAAS
jgi:hypothetical protein|tara:strand:+ start:799 stop:915 length:117 start_codon:yes stop_codon:yes gene_type:complete